MTRPVPYGALLIVLSVLAAVLRLAHLENRPMHCDEAVHAIRFGHLLEKGDYRYDRHEYHGPSLNYLTLPIAWTTARDSLAQVNEFQLRVVPALFGIALVGLCGCLRGFLGTTGALAAALFVSVSPSLSFYSRYYIQEMLLVFFQTAAIVALWNYIAAMNREKAPGRRGRGSSAWLLALAVSLGMAHASKETCVIAFFAMLVAGATAVTQLRQIGAGRLGAHTLFVAVFAVGVSAVFFSSWFQNPTGVLDSYATWGDYLARASGEGSAGRHVHPWHYYLSVLLWFQRDGGPLWTELGIAVLAMVGLIVAATGRGIAASRLPFARFVSIYLLVVGVVYSALPYKTPWCALTMASGVVLLAGVGVESLWQRAPKGVTRTALLAIILAIASHLAWQAWQACFVYTDDPRSPYVYAPTTTEIPDLCDSIVRFADRQPEGRAMPIQVICPDDDYWPLPWYLRSFSRVAWYREPPATGPPAPLIISQPVDQRGLVDYLYVQPPPGQRHAYVPFPPERHDDWRLRPHVPLQVLVQWDRWLDFVDE